MKIDARALSDLKDAGLWSQFGEYLRVVDSDVLNYSVIEKVLKKPNIHVRSRLLMLNYDETVRAEIPSEDVGLNSGSYNENYQNGQRRTLNIELVNNDGKYNPNVNNLWISDKFRLDIGIEWQGDVMWFPRGIYVISNPTSSHQNSEKTITLSLSDKFAILEGKQGTLEATYEIPVDSDIEGAIIGILTIDNGAGYPLDLKPIIYSSNFKGRKMPYTLTKDAGNTLGSMLLDIATILNAEMYYNDQGNLCIIDANEVMLDTQKPSIYNYSDDNNEYFGSSITYDFENVVNEVHIVGDNINNEIFYAMAQNTNVRSPLCIQRVGRRISYINDSAISNNSLAQQRAAYELRKVLILGTALSMEVSFNPLLFVNNVISVTDEHYGLEEQRFLIQSISYNIGNENKMTLTCSNVLDFSVVE